MSHLARTDGVSTAVYVLRACAGKGLHVSRIYFFVGATSPCLALA